MLSVIFSNKSLLKHKSLLLCIILLYSIMIGTMILFWLGMKVISKKLLFIEENSRVCLFLAELWCCSTKRNNQETSE